MTDDKFCNWIDPDPDPEADGEPCRNLGTTIYAGPPGHEDLLTYRCKFHDMARLWGRPSFLLTEEEAEVILVMAL